MIKDTKIVLALALFGGFFYWVAVDKLGSFGGDIELLRDDNVRYIIALGLAAIIGILASRHRWLAGALVILSQFPLGGPSGTLNPAASLWPLGVLVACLPAAIIAEAAGKTFWHYWDKVRK